jgi:hypothetical protein
MVIGAIPGCGVDERAQPCRDALILQSETSCPDMLVVI